MNNKRRRKNSNNLKNKNFIEAFINAVNGIVHGFKTQRNLKIQLVIAIIVILVGVRLELNKTDFIAIIFSIFLVFVTEMINTAIESAVDLETEQYNKLAKIAKDVAAGAVLLASLNAVIIAIIILINK